MDASLIEEFVERGVVVVPGVLSAVEVARARQGLQDYLLEHCGCDTSSPASLQETAPALGQLSSTGGAGGILDIFWATFKMPLLEHAGTCVYMLCVSLPLSPSLSLPHTLTPPLRT